MEINETMKDFARAYLRAKKNADEATERGEKSVAIVKGIERDAYGALLAAEIAPLLAEQVQTPPAPTCVETIENRSMRPHVLEPQTKPALESRGRR